ncbi:Fe-S cluster assembly protein HesB [Asaccharospora irregularis]|uniref:HesB-like selenoprotein n=1 Tax=Asaccharospora irregularis DSM 2635 TaxID=1121321 RepID=A0A1M5KSX1_9FIRM|nr:Fe-S cluster assembly protein HesB [Asaccharospora irregularis]SHG55952.1 HesB-like selenoprotein [Asaccharospora irregularis DSM 2635]
MKITLPETAVDTLKDILKDNQDKPNSIRVYFAGVACSGPSFGLALDEKKDDDLTYEFEGLEFVMNTNEYNTYGDIVIEDTGFGFRVVPENMKDQGGCDGGCSGCGGH